MRKIIVLLGCPGAGKGTQAKILGDWLGIPQVSTGEILREQFASSTHAAQMNTGGLVNDDLVNSLVCHRLGREDCSKGFILDGYPRNVAQAETFRRQLQQPDNLMTVEIVVDEEALFSRLLSRRRHDDREDVIRERLRIHREETLPVVDYFKAAGPFCRVNGAAPVEDVASAIRNSVSELLIRSAA